MRQQNPTSTLEPSGARNESETRLHGRWLVLARVGWFAVTVTLVILNLFALPDTYGSYFTFTPSVLQDLHRLGLSPTLYSILLTVEYAPFQLVYLALGLLLFWRRSDDRMALFCAFTLVTFGNALPLYDFTRGSIVPTLASNAVLRVVALVLFATGEASLVLFFYLFPSGRFAPRWMRWGALLVAAYWLAVVFFPVLPSNAGGPATYVIPLSLLSAVVVQVYRYRRVSAPKERQKTRWAVFGFTLAILLLVVYALVGFLVVPPSIQNDPVLGNLNPLFQVALLLIAIFIAVSILRSRLWDIDVIINRTLVYGTLTVSLVLVYAGLIFVLQSLSSAFIKQNNDVAIVVSTLVIAALFQPLRQRLQRVIDRRFYRRKYDAARTLAQFSATLRGEVDLQQLRENLVAVVEETMQPAHVSLWVSQPDRAKVSSSEVGKASPEKSRRT